MRGVKHARGQLDEDDEGRREDCQGESPAGLLYGKGLPHLTPSSLLYGNGSVLAVREGNPSRTRAHAYGTPAYPPQRRTQSATSLRNL